VAAPAMAWIFEVSVAPRLIAVAWTVLVPDPSM
jgi:hypothetical protein